MSSRREREEELRKQKKALRKSFKKTYAGTERIGSKRISDTKKFLLVGSVALVIIIIVSVQFFVPPTPTCYYTEGDFVYGFLHQTNSTISFDRIVAYYHLRPSHTKLSCDIKDWFNSTYKVIPPTLVPTPYVGADYITYQFVDEDNPISFATTMDNGTPLVMSTWVGVTEISVTPSSIVHNTKRLVRFKLDIVTHVAVDQCNISLQFYKNPPSTTVQFHNISKGLVNQTTLTFYTNNLTIPAESHVILDFYLSINSTIAQSLNLLQKGTLHLKMNNKVLGAFPSYSHFKESTIDFSEFYIGGDPPELKKSSFLDIVVQVPVFKITIT